MQFNIARVPHMTFGAGQIGAVPEVAASLGGGPVLIVADAILAELGITDRLTAGLTTAGIPSRLAAEVSGEPKEALVDDLSARARESDARVVIGLGGGAAMDAAKLVAAIAPSGKPAEEFALSARPLPTNTLPA
ncbi:MAG: iron-containing alcohol dehydrogenase, partial [Pseudomonadota bacterium]